jgi:hypothetical protein
VRCGRENWSDGRDHVLLMARSGSRVKSGEEWMGIGKHLLGRPQQEGDRSLTARRTGDTPHDRADRARARNPSEMDGSGTSPRKLLVRTEMDGVPLVVARKDLEQEEFCDPCFFDDDYSCVLESPPRGVAGCCSL